MLPDRVSNPGPLTYESGALPIALCGLALSLILKELKHFSVFICPFEKRSYYVIPLGVRPSVHPSMCKLFHFHITPPTVYVRFS